MAIATATQRQTLAAAYGSAATNAGLQTTAAAATQGTEVTGTGYARQPLTWTAGTGGVVTASATFTVPANVTVQSSFLTTALTGGTFLDSVAVSYSSQTSSGTLTVNYTFTES